MFNSILDCAEWKDTFGGGLENVYNGCVFVFITGPSNVVTNEMCNGP